MPHILGDRWLLPRITGLMERHPEIETRYTTSESLLPDGIFRYAQEPAADEDGFHQFAREVILVSAPHYWHEIGAPSAARDLTDAVLPEHPQTDLQWRSFVAAHGCEDVQLLGASR